MNQTSLSLSWPRETWLVRLADILILLKLRLTLLAVLSVGAGFLLGSTGAPDWALLLHVLSGTGLLAASSAILNQYLERDLDARMLRTQGRPLPGGRISTTESLALGVGCAVAGLAQLWLMVNTVAVGLGVVISVVYLLVYTPMKRHSTCNILCGAVSGALPPLVGWAGARGELSLEAWSLFILMYLWQIPHFLAIAWLYREDYARAEMKMPGVPGAGGELIFRQMTPCALAMIPASLWPTVMGLSGVAHYYNALALGTIFLGCVAVFEMYRTTRWARLVFVASIVYLPAVFFTMVMDKIL